MYVRIFTIRGVEPLRGAGLASTLLRGAAALRCLASDYARSHLDSNRNILAALLRRACAADTVGERSTVSDPGFVGIALSLVLRMGSFVASGTNISVEGVLLETLKTFDLGTRGFMCRI